MKFIATLILLALGCAWAQPGDPLDVRGVVTEPGTNLPVAGAQVTLYEFVEDATRLVVRSVYATTGTDSRGTFEFHAERFGDYFLEAKRDGYTPTNAGEPGDVNAEAAEAPLTLSRDQPTREFKFNLMRPAELRGRVIDEDGKPVVGLIAAAGTSLESPAFGRHSAATDRDGYFTIPKLPPDRYLVRISKSRDFGPVMVRKSGDTQTPSGRVYELSFMDGELEFVSQDLETSYWPGGPDAQTAFPIPVSPGASTNLGTITLRQTSYRARVSVLAGGCALDEGWQISSITATSPLHFTDVPCANEFLIRNLKPGSYWFLLSNGEDGAKNRQGLAFVEMTREDVGATLTMAPGATVSGRVIGTDGAALDGITVTAVPLIAGLRPLIQTARLDSESVFTFRSLAGTRYQISLQDLTGKYRIKEIRYNGIPAPNGVITPGADGRLEIAITDSTR
jgi:hypothetical protein